MSQLCPQGHSSTMDDFCSECGSVMSPAAATSVAASSAASASSSAGGSCANCGEPHGADDVFCENCGFDFSSGSLPDAAPAPDPVAPGAPATTPTGAAAMTAVVSVDVAYFAAMVEGDEVALPDPIPAPSTVSLAAGKALIGRHSESRGIFPEIDVEALTADPAVSSRHAMLHRNEEGAWEINDLGSTNGTRLGDHEGDEIAAGTAHGVDVGVPVFVGAWTRIELQAGAPG